MTTKNEEEDELYNPMHGTYTPPILPDSMPRERVIAQNSPAQKPGSSTPTVVELSDLKNNYTLTRQEAEQILIQDPGTGKPIYLFNYYLQQIKAEGVQRRSDSMYGNNKDVQSDIERLYQKMENTAPEDDIKKLIREHLNTRDLNSSATFTQQEFWKSVRSALNEKLQFQPKETLRATTYDVDEQKRQKSQLKNNTFLGKISGQMGLRQSDDIIDYRSDKARANPFFDDIAEGHTKLEMDIEARSTSIKNRLGEITGRTTPLTDVSDSDEENTSLKNS